MAAIAAEVGIEIAEVAGPEVEATAMSTAKSAARLAERLVDVGTGIAIGQMSSESVPAVVPEPKEGGGADGMSAAGVSAKAGYKRYWQILGVLCILVMLCIFVYLATCTLKPFSSHCPLMNRSPRIVRFLHDTIL